MSISWNAPAALAGIALIALPIAIHLLVRQHARTLRYPSLRFLRETQLAAFRRRTIQDAALLLCRVAILTLAAVALAGPVLQFASRTAGYASRTSRAVVQIGEQPVPPLPDAFRSATFTRARAADAIPDAIRWLDQQPPSSREIVIAGALKRGSIGDADLAAIPEPIGIRFAPVARDWPAQVTWPVLTRRDDTLLRLDRMLHLQPDSTRVTEGATTAVAQDLVAIAAADRDLPLAQAALRVALESGVAWSTFDRRVVIAWDGAELPAREGTHVIRMPVPSPPSAAADAVKTALEAESPHIEAFEPVTIAAEQLAAWTRPPGAPAISAPVADEGDRRWAWGAVLVLLAVESWLRRARVAKVASADVPETRVA